MSHIFTGKERDAESGLDYFGARFYGSALGRFTSPDWSDKPQPVPYADFSDPQTLSLYAYLRNNPLSRTDPDGHCCWDYLVGFAKGTANVLLDDASNLAKNGDPIQRVVNGAVQTDFRFTPANSAQANGMEAGNKYGPDAVGIAMAVGGGKFSSKDPLVGNLANEIDATYPGHVKGVNVPVRGPNGELVTDADIVTGNAIIQVKSGGGKGLSGQVETTENATGTVTVGYGPNLKGSVVKEMQSKGQLVTTDKQALIKVLRPDEH